MLRSVIAWGSRFRILVLVTAVLVVVLGAIELREAPVDVLPEFSPTQVEVQTEALGLSAAEVEQLITVPLEADLLNGVPWLADIRSDSVPGLSSIQLIFEPGTETLNARQVVNERITQARALPNVSKPPVMLQPLSSASRLTMIGLTPRTQSLIDTSVLARWTIRPRLMSVPGVANVSIWGQRDQQLHVQVDPKRLADNKVTLAQVVQTAGNATWVSPLSFLEASTPGTGGFVDMANQRLGVQHVSPIVSPETLAQVTVEDTPDRIVRLGDVATVVTDHQPLIGDASAGDRAGMIMVVEKFPGANTLEVTQGVEQAMAELAPGLTGVDVDTGLYRPATYLDLGIGNVETWLLFGALLLVAALGLLLFSWRAALVSLVAIVVSVAAAGLVLFLTGATVNAIVLAGLVVAIGLVVDDAVVDVERVARRRAEPLADGSRPWRAVFVDTSFEMRSALLYGTAITLLVVLPVFFLGDRERALFTPLAVAYMVAVAASMVVALTVTPALCALVLDGSRAGRREPGGPLRRLRRPYERLLGPVLASSRTVVVAAIVVAVATVAGLPFLAPELVPAQKDPNLLVQFDGPAGISLPEMDRMSAAASAELRTLPGVRTVGAHAGRAVLGDQVVDVNSSELWVGLDPDADYDGTVAAVTQVVRGYPGIIGNVLTAEKRATADVLAGTRDDVTVRLFGQDVDLLRAKADEIRGLIAGVDGVVDPVVEQQPSQPTMVVDADLAAGDRAGIKPGDVRRAAATLLQGTEVGNLFQDQKVFEVVVRGTPQIRQSVSNIENLLIDTPAGGQVRLGDVAKVRVEPRPDVIHREDVSRRVDVTADVRGRSVAAVTEDVRARVGGVAFPQENHAEVLGDQLAAQDATARLLAISAGVVLGLFLLLQGAFASWRLAAGALLALPGALAGGVAAALVSGRVLSLGALLGLLLVFGLAVRNGILLVRRCQQLRDAEGAEFGSGLVRQAALDRLAPVVITTVATVALLAPLLFLGGAAGLEIVAPMAVTVLCGLVTSTVLSLLVWPALYLAWGRKEIARVGPDLTVREEVSV